MTNVTPSELKSSIAHAPHFGIEDDNIHDQFYRELTETVRQAPADGVVILLLVGLLLVVVGCCWLVVGWLLVGCLLLLWCCVLLWCCGVVVLWCCGVVVLWCCWLCCVVGCVVLCRVGRVGENDNGTRLRTFAAECNIAFMNTFFGDVPLSTWRASRGQEHLIDYTAISMKDKSRVVHAGVCKDSNMAFSTEIDHRPVSVQVRTCPPKRIAVNNTPRTEHSRRCSSFKPTTTAAGSSTSSASVHNS